VPSWDIRQVALCEAKGIPVRKDAHILDYGCGAGRRVYELLDAGYLNASGYDVLDYLKLRDPADRSRFHIAPDGRIPLPDASLDFVFSDQVFEHVMDQPAAWQEIVRVLKPGGASVHVIPTKWQFIEPHVKVPFGGFQLFKHYSYYLFWAALGIRNEYQQGLSARETASRNYHYSRTALNYWSSWKYRQLFRTLPIRWSWEEVAYMEASYKPRIRQLASVARRVSLVATMIRTFHTRVLFIVKAPRRDESEAESQFQRSRRRRAPVSPG
jgi:SAM-dependent methyltransferase